MSNIKEVNLNRNTVIVHLSDLENELLRLLMQFEVSKCRIPIISKMFVSFSFSKCDKNSHTKSSYSTEEKHTNHFEQTLKLCNLLSLRT